VPLIAVTSATANTVTIAAGGRLSGHQLEFLGSILVHSDKTAFLLFEGAEEDVRAASERADVPFERVLESVQIRLPMAKRR
jgi:hypothetical protein